MQALHFKPGRFTWNKKGAAPSNHAANKPNSLRHRQSSAQKKRLARANRFSAASLYSCQPDTQ